MIVPMKRRTLLLLIASLALPSTVLAADAKPTLAAKSKAAADWPLFRGDPMASGVARSSLPARPSVLWKFNTKDGGFEATAVCADGVVYIGSLDGNFYAIELASGKEKWRYKTELGFSAPAAVRDGRVFVGDSDGKFYCFDARTTDETKRVLWSVEVGGEINSGPNFYKDSVLFGSQDATLYCLNANDGKEVWKFQIQDQVRCSPTIVDNRAFLAGCDGKLHIIDLDKGESVGNVPIESPTGSTPAVLGDHVFVGTQGSAFFAIDWKQAKVDWTYKPERSMPFQSSAAVTPSLVIVGCQDKQVHAINSTTGAPVWTFPTKARVDSSPVVVGERVFFGSFDGHLYAVNIASGKVDWDYEAGGKFQSSPAVVDDKLLIGNDDGTLYCFGTKK